MPPGLHCRICPSVVSTSMRPVMMNTSWRFGARCQSWSSPSGSSTTTELAGLKTFEI
jgi:hypothetical protein